jgi:hypothetical protein
MEHEDLQAAPNGGDYRARTAFWARQSRLDDDLDRRLLSALIDWFRQDWAFSRVVFFTSEQDERQQRILADAGLRQCYVKEGRSRWVVFE